MINYDEMIFGHARSIIKLNDDDFDIDEYCESNDLSDSDLDRITFMIDAIDQLINPAIKKYIEFLNQIDHTEFPYSNDDFEFNLEYCNDNILIIYLEYLADSNENCELIIFYHDQSNSFELIIDQIIQNFESMQKSIFKSN